MEIASSRPVSGDEIVRRVAKIACERICQRLIRAYRRMPAHLCGDDSSLANLWEDICVQAQQPDRHRSIFWEETYEASLLGFLEGEVDDLDATNSLGHLASNRCRDGLERGRHEPPEKWSSEELGRFILQYYVLPAAEGYSNARIRGYFERWDRRD